IVELDEFVARRAAPGLNLIDDDCAMPAREIRRSCGIGARVDTAGVSDGSAVLGGFIFFPVVEKAVIEGLAVTGRAGLRRTVFADETADVRGLHPLAGFTP